MADISSCIGGQCYAVTGFADVTGCIVGCIYVHPCVGVADVSTCSLTDGEDTPFCRCCSCY